jgi:S1-C subfamily serine protease
VRPEILDRLGVETDTGAFVTDVLPNTGAEEAGIEPGDVILEIDGQTVESPEDVGQIILDMAPGDRIEVVVERDGRERTIRATLGSRGVPG